MLEREIKNSFKIFNDLINNIITEFTKYNLDENTLILLVKMTNHLMTFTQKVLIKLLFKFFQSINVIGKSLDIDLADIDEMIDVLFDELSKSLNNLLNSEHDINKQEYIQEIVENLKFLKDIINSLSNLFLSIIKFQTDLITEEQFREDYRKFKGDLAKYKGRIDEIFIEEEKIEIPIT